MLGDIDPAYGMDEVTRQQPVINPFEETRAAGQPALDTYDEWETLMGTPEVTAQQPTNVPGTPIVPTAAQAAPTVEQTAAMEDIQARGIDPRMARSYQENIRLMGDPRMHPPMGGMPIGVVPPPPSDGWFASNEGLSGQEYAEKHNIPYAKGGRASYTKGGLAKILGV